VNLSDEIYFPDKCIPFLFVCKRTLFFSRAISEWKTQSDLLSRVWQTVRENDVFQGEEISETLDLFLRVFAFVLHTRNEFLVTGKFTKDRNRSSMSLRTNIYEPDLKSFLRILEKTNENSKFCETNSLENFGRQDRLRSLWRSDRSSDYREDEL